MLKKFIKFQKKLKAHIPHPLGCCVDFFKLASGVQERVLDMNQVRNQVLEVQRLRYAIKGVADHYDYCLIDIPPSLNWLCRAVFYASNYSLICAIPEPFSVLAESIRRHHEIDVLGVILSLWDDRSTFNGPLLKGIEMSFPGKTLNARIRKDKMIPKAVFDGKPVFLTDRSSRASEDFQGLAQEVLRLLEGIEESKEREVAHV